MLPLIVQMPLRPFPMPFMDMTAMTVSPSSSEMEFHSAFASGGRAGSGAELLTLAGIVTLVSEEALNAYSPMLVTLGSYYIVLLLSNSDILLYPHPNY